MILRTLRTDIDDTRRELGEHAENVTVAVENAATAITAIGIVAVLALILAGYAVTTTGAKPPW